MIVIKAWNRPIYLYRVLRRLVEIDVSQHRLNILISIDGHPDPSMREQMQEAVRMSKITDDPFVRVRYSDKTLGCAGHTIKLFEYAFNEENSPYVIHIEDDHYLGKDCIPYLMWASVKVRREDYFAACSFNRPVHQTWKNNRGSCDKFFAKHWFDGSGPIMLTDDRWKEITEKGGLFGVDYISEKGRTFDCQGDEWLKEVRFSNRLSWVWPMHKYFGANKKSLFPRVNRSINIGRVGLHANAEIHKQIQYNSELIDDYEDFEPIRYQSEIELDEQKYIEHGIENAS